MRERARSEREGEKAAAPFFFLSLFLSLSLSPSFSRPLSRMTGAISFFGPFMARFSFRIGVRASTNNSLLLTQRKKKRESESLEEGGEQKGARGGTSFVAPSFASLFHPLSLDFCGGTFAVSALSLLS